MHLSLSTLFVLFLGPCVLAGMIGFVLWVIHEENKDERAREKAAMKPPAAD